MSSFGDMEPGDAVDTDPPDPEALARRMVVLERRLSRDANRPETFDQLHPQEQALRVYVLAEIIALLVREWQKAPL